MENTRMGKVLVTARIENLEDVFSAQKGLLAAEQIRTVEVTDALVDTGASTLSLPRRWIAQLGLQPLRPRAHEPVGAPSIFRCFGLLRLHVQGRDCICDVVEIADDCPILIGQIPLEALDFVVDSKGQKLIGNPEHGGEQILELY